MSLVLPVARLLFSGYVRQADVVPYGGVQPIACLLSLLRYGGGSPARYALLSLLFLRNCSGSLTRMNRTEHFPNSFIALYKVGGGKQEEK